MSTCMRGGVKYNRHRYENNKCEACGKDRQIHDPEEVKYLNDPIVEALEPQGELTTNDITALLEA